jgi:adenylosuccinate lyase
MAFICNIFASSINKHSDMSLSDLTAVSPIDGRYHNKTAELAGYFSEFALIKYRVTVEIAYFKALCKIPLPQLALVSDELLNRLDVQGESFNETDARRIKEIESVTNHDVKAVEYFLKEQFDTIGLSDYKEFIHFALTSQDINNTAVPMSVKDAFEQVYIPILVTLTDSIEAMAEQWKEIPMLAKTHGQPASPTRLGKELMVFAYRIKKQIEHFEHTPFTAKFGGATGNFNAHVVTYPAIDWVSFGNSFVSDSLGLQREEYTTQIANYDQLGAFLDILKRINTILIDLCRDIWTYISMEYFKQKIKKGEVGSSTMPHKVNPIDFENAEGNLGIANAILEHLTNKLPISRLQRDLTDSTVLRNIGVPFGHILIAFKSLEKGLGKLLLNEEALKNDLNKNWAVVAEAVQTILRRENYPNPYEALKELTRTNEGINENSIRAFIDTLSVTEQVKNELRAITPFNYTGV